MRYSLCRSLTLIGVVVGGFVFPLRGEVVEIAELGKKTSEALASVEAGHPPQLEAINKKYLEVLRKLEADRQKEGALRELLTVRDDLKLFETKGEVRQVPSFPRLQFLRDAYAKEFHRIELERMELRVGFVEAQLTQLTELLGNKTKAKLTADALEVENQIKVVEPAFIKARQEMFNWRRLAPGDAVKKPAETTSTPKQTPPAAPEGTPASSPDVPATPKAPTPPPPTTSG